MPYIYNFSTTILLPEHLDAFRRMGLTSKASHIDKLSRMPSIRPETAPEEVRESVEQGLYPFRFESDDVIIVGGLPDAMFYLIEALPDPAPLVVMPLVRRRGSEVICLGLREVLLDVENARPGIHALDSVGQRILSELDCGGRRPLAPSVPSTVGLDKYHTGNDNTGGSGEKSAEPSASKQG